MMIYTIHCTTFSACSIYEIIDISIADGIPAGFGRKSAYADKKHHVLGNELYQFNSTQGY